MIGRRSRLALVAAVVAMVVPGCATSGLSFVIDDRVEILAPEENEEVSLPFTLDWVAEDIDDAVSFVVFFNRSPMRPDETLHDLVPEGDPCRADPSCPDEEWLAARTIYVTDGTSLTIQWLPDRRDNPRTRDRHDVTIVLLDGEGRRAGESTFYREFIVQREG